MTTSQSEFRSGLLDPQIPAPDGLRGADDDPAGKRYDVYRNNVTHSLIDALRTAFPLVRRLVGAARFDALAPEYVRQHPPASPLMMFYGQDFPDFIDKFEPLAHIGYLRDAARLDLALRASYHAADASPLTAADLQSLSADELLGATFALAPATRILRSEWPLYDIWRYASDPDAPKPREIAQDVIVTRQDFDPEPHVLPQGCAAWLEALAAGNPFGASHEVALAAFPAFDLGACLTCALQNGALTMTNHKE